MRVDTRVVGEIKYLENPTSMIVMTMADDNGIGVLQGNVELMRVFLKNESLAGVEEDIGGRCLYPE